MKKTLVKNILKSIFMPAFMLAILLSATFSIPLRKNRLNESHASQITASVVTNVLGISATPAEYYDLTDDYFLYSEDQTTSELCWVYSSMKVLESSLMVQTGEWHNFSEVGTAYLAAYHGETSALNTTGFFEDFSTTTKLYGLIYENDFSNEKYFELANVSNDDLDNYEYVLDYARKDISNSVDAVSISENESFKKLSAEEKQAFIKKYITKYGGLFVGLKVDENNDGAIEKYSYESVREDRSKTVNMFNPSRIEDSGKPLNGDHAVAIIGWDNECGFLALNSWGSSYSKFYIPFGYEHLYSTLYGYVINGQNDKIEISETTAEEFSQDIMPSSNNLKNLFCYGEDVTLKLAVRGTSNFKNVQVKVFKGTEDVTKLFLITYNDSQSIVNLHLIDSTSSRVGGTYVIQVIEGVDTLLGTQDLFVFTGAEIQSLALTKEGASTSESILLMNSYLNSDYSETFYINDISPYTMTFGMLDINSSLTTLESLEYEIVGAAVSYVSDGITIRDDLDITIQANTGTSYDVKNTYEIYIPSRYDYRGKLISFKIKVKSNQSEYKTLFSQEYAINIFVGVADPNVKTQNSNSIQYVMNGGRNSTSNIQRYPNYTVDPSVTGFVLENPTKNGERFIGWYTTSDFSGTAVKEINSAFSGNLILYACWEEQDVEYIDATLKVHSVKDYNGDAKAVTNIIYGDSVKLEYDLKELSALTGFNYSATYYYYVNGVQTSKTEISQGSQKIYFDINFPHLKATSYHVAVVMEIAISHNKTERVTEVLDFEVGKKEVLFNYVNIEETYNAAGHLPSISVDEDSIYEEDLLTFKFTLSDTEKVNAGTYDFSVKEINNSNYFFDGTKKGTLTINKRPLTLTWKSDKVTYNGKSQIPEYELGGFAGSDVLEVLIKTDAEMINVGTYTVSVDELSLSSENYTLNNVKPCEFEIKPATIRIAFTSVDDRVAVSPEYRKRSTYSIHGTLYDDFADLKFSVVCAGYEATESGMYKITGSYDNPNYVVEFIDGVYTLFGYYFVTYTLPNGEIYKERVEANEDPIGITDEIYPISKLEKLIYSEELKNNGNHDLFVEVKVKSYTWAVIVGLVIFAFGAIYWFATRKQRRNKVS